MDNFIKILLTLVSLTAFMLGLIVGVMLASEGYVKFNRYQTVASHSKQDKYNTMDELIEDVLK